MAEEKPHTTAVEVNGIRFEIRLKNHVIPLPPKEENAMTEVEFEIVVINNTSNTFYFDFGDGFTPLLMKANGEIIPGGSGSDWRGQAIESHFRLSKPGETVSFVDYYVVAYDEEEYICRFGTERGTWWVSEAVDAGNYEFEFTYRNDESALKVGLLRGGNKILDNIWTGEVVLPVLEFQLVDKPI
ncbi:MAG: hypothetical protein SWX82_06905 [Cyanobacteriota bacterium]|nr:hypothetical protein [Cyanobacteriota bacterium]